MDGSRALIDIFAPHGKAARIVLTNDTTLRYDLNRARLQSNP